MQLKIVVFPAPLGPMRPTISNSSTRRVTSVRAWRPPKRMDTSSALRTGAAAGRRPPSPSGPPAGARRSAPSRTGIAAPSPPQRPASVGQLEALAPEPPADGRGDGPQPVGLEDEGEDGQQGAQGLDVVPGVDLDGAPADGPG